jgi:hypothetical protein
MRNSRVVRESLILHRTFYFEISSIDTCARRDKERHEVFPAERAVGWSLADRYFADHFAAGIIDENAIRGDVEIPFFIGAKAVGNAIYPAEENPIVGGITGAIEIECVDGVPV